MTHLGWGCCVIDSRPIHFALRGLRTPGQISLAEYDFRLVRSEQAPLTISDVEISIRADLLVHGLSRNGDQIGLALLRMTQDDADTDQARERREEMGRYVATLARRHLEENFPRELETAAVANRLCLSIDVQHGEVFAAPNAIVRRMNDIENACRVIAAMWDRIT